MVVVLCIIYLNYHRYYYSSGPTYGEFDKDKIFITGCYSSIGVSDYGFGIFRDGLLTDLWNSFETGSHTKK